MKKAFFFDRDGVLVQSIYRYDKEYKKMMDCAPLNISELTINENAKEIVSCLKDKGFVPIIITNQPDFLKKSLFLKDYEEITTKICLELGLKRNQVFECFHKEGFSLECGCRKPKAGLFLMAKGMFNLNLENSWIVGDSWKDIQAAEIAGIKNTIFLKRKALEGLQAGNEEEAAKLKELNLKPKHFLEDISEIKNLIN